LRGLGADLVIADECFYLNATAFKVGPIAMMLDGAIVLCGSSPSSDSSDILDILHEKTADGKEMCEFIDYQMECPVCMEIRNKLYPGYICKHRMGMRPPHMSLENVMVAASLLKSQKDVVSREIFGQACAPSNMYFPSESLDHLENAINNDNDAPPQFIFASFDPSGASRNYHDGHTSDYAFVTGYKDHNRWVVSYIYTLQTHTYIHNYFI
jgi:hypothetical protein